MPLSDEQRKAIAAMHAHIASLPSPFGKAESVDQRARQPDLAHLPEDVTVRLEIAPPSAQPHPLLDTGALKAPERVPVYFYSLKDQAESDPTNTHVIFHIHGGGNVVGHPTDEPRIDFYVQLLRECASNSGGARKYVVIAPSYRLATVPEHTFPAALQDLVAAYDYVLGKGYNASNIVISGESAGGSHAVVLTHLVVQSDRAPPHGVVSIAPDAIRSAGRLSELGRMNAHGDMVRGDGMKTLTKSYVGDSGVAPTDPLVSAAYIPFAASWPKTLIMVGSADMLIDGSRELARRLSALDLAVELVEYDGVPHAWWLMRQAFPEEFQDEVQRIARFAF